MKKEKGITILVLIITVVVMIILISATVYYGASSTETIRLENFSYELQQIQSQVDVDYEKIKAGDIKYITLRRRIHKCTTRGSKHIRKS